MNPEMAYRTRLAEGFLAEARQDMADRRWRACVSSSQLAVENSAKAALAMLGPVGKTHNPAAMLYAAVREGRFDGRLVQIVDELAECASRMGSDVHAESDYGDDATWRTPWEILTEADAQESMRIAEKAVASLHTLAAMTQNPQQGAPDCGIQASEQKGR